MSASDVLVGGVVIVLLVGGLWGVGFMATHVSQPIESGTYEGTTVDYSHQRGLIFTTNDLTTKTNDRSSTREDWCVPDDQPHLVEKVRDIGEGDRVRIEYTRPLWIWPDTCDGGLPVITNIEVLNETRGGA